ncbi:hypothetical protein [Leptospira borgpetersenii]|uniref:Uncharacterized protein n=1 Tax=Leptospira borgpetersenii serovar Ballum TaxID=280505 RepID=A0A0E3BJR7_LEPBO|nr:hypothetical protein [Leptospira borgpetersenii]EMO07901.1 hypothetical protein LEP1GSC137_1705 [Leptospira borgpetersenii str. Noumea 25]ALO25277.1 hypothetical protein LBBP_00959 [Leptospira borgpetersenii serovar Ballum]ANH00225.1 Uncharacterized protein LB4E_0760 [Leptospira borgpetersenii str. 4E]EKQ98537.1 hypothetical protein LEP1GSC121_3317 [Leptospira borgpetersenii serovar Castellonis str. 200801910]KGE21965.1 hypothetical protein IQ66_19330 [Leptospira borgpetersenii serovar Ball
MDIESNDNLESESKEFPRWLAQTLAQNLDRKYHFFLRENRNEPTWITWGKAAEDACKSLLTYITQFKFKEIKLDPHWKYRSIYASNLINKVAINSSPKRRIELISDLINNFARKQEDYHPVNPLEQRMIHLEANRINCYARDLKKDFEASLHKTWVQAARRNYLRMLRTDFTSPEREFTDWDLCFRFNRARINSLSVSSWTECIKKNFLRLERNLQNL